MAKERIPIPKELAAEVMYASDRTCCVCNERGKAVQIHHIDEDPSKNEESNLAVLCFDCHEETQVKGGFGRKLDAQQVIKYKSEWIQRVQKRRSDADRTASIGKIQSNEVQEINVQDDIVFEEQIDFEALQDNWEFEKQDVERYLAKIIDIKAVVYKHAQNDFQRGTTYGAVQASNEVIDFYEEVLNELSKFYPHKHFGGDARQYMNEQIAGRANWHRSINETYGAGRSGTIVSSFVSASMIEEVDEMVMEMISCLQLKYDFDYVQWGAKWKGIEFK